MYYVSARVYFRISLKRGHANAYIAANFKGGRGAIPI